MPSCFLDVVGYTMAMILLLLAVGQSSSSLGLQGEMATPLALGPLEWALLAVYPASSVVAAALTVGLALHAS